MQAGRDPAADVHADRLPDADDPAAPAGRRPGRPPRRDRPRRRRADLDASRSSPNRPRSPTRMMYAAPDRRTTHRLCRAGRADAVVDARAGRVPGHVRAASRRWTSWQSSCGLDPIELRVRNEPEIDPASREPFSTAATSSAACASGAERFGWADRDPTPGLAATAGGWPAPAWPRRPTPLRRPPSTARARREGDGTLHDRAGRGRHRHGRAHRAHPDRRGRPRGAAGSGASQHRRHRARPGASVAGGSSGTTVLGRRGRRGVPAMLRRRRRRTATARRRTEVGRGRGPRAERSPCTRSAPSSPRCGSIADTGEIRVPRMLGVFAAAASSTRARPARSSSAA